jgi:hypothetical protein
MNAPKFTPGPWLVEAKNCHIGTIATVHGCTDGWVDIWSENWIAAGLGGKVQDANIALIAAAPELYSQLEFAVKLLEGLPGFAGTAQGEAMRAALAKATQP